MKTHQNKRQAHEQNVAIRGSGNVFADIGFAQAQAADLKIKAGLTLQIYRRIKELGLTQVKVAHQLGVSQPDVSKLMRGRYTGYSIDRLLAFLNALEMDVDIIVRRKHPGKKTHRGIVRIKEAAVA